METKTMCVCGKEIKLYRCPECYYLPTWVSDRKEHREWHRRRQAALGQPDLVAGIAGAANYKKQNTIETMRTVSSAGRRVVPRRGSASTPRVNLRRQARGF